MGDHREPSKPAGPAQPGALEGTEPVEQTEGDERQAGAIEQRGERHLAAPPAQGDPRYEPQAEGLAPGEHEAEHRGRQGG
jgi:hypothetical protein